MRPPRATSHTPGISHLLRLHQLLGQVLGLDLSLLGLGLCRRLLVLGIREALLKAAVGLIAAITRLGT